MFLDFIVGDLRFFFSDQLFVIRSCVLKLGPERPLETRGRALWIGIDISVLIVKWPQLSIAGIRHLCDKGFDWHRQYFRSELAVQAAKVIPSVRRWGST